MYLIFHFFAFALFSILLTKEVLVDQRTGWTIYYAVFLVYELLLVLYYL